MARFKMLHELSNNLTLITCTSKQKQHVQRNRHVCMFKGTKERQRSIIIITLQPNYLELVSNLFPSFMFKLAFPATYVVQGFLPFIHKSKPSPHQDHFNSLTLPSPSLQLVQLLCIQKCNNFNFSKYIIIMHCNCSSRVQIFADDTCGNMDISKCQLRFT